MQKTVFNLRLLPLVWGYGLLLVYKTSEEALEEVPGEALEKASEEASGEALEKALEKTLEKTFPKNAIVAFKLLNNREFDLFENSFKLHIGKIGSSKKKISFYSLPYICNSLKSEEEKALPLITQILNDTDSFVTLAKSLLEKPEAFEKTMPEAFETEKPENFTKPELEAFTKPETFEKCTSYPTENSIFSNKLSLSLCEPTNTTKHNNYTIKAKEHANENTNTEQNKDESNDNDDNDDDNLMCTCYI